MAISTNNSICKASKTETLYGVTFLLSLRELTVVRRDTPKVFVVDLEKFGLSTGAVQYIKDVLVAMDDDAIKAVWPGPSMRDLETLKLVKVLECGFSDREVCLQLMNDHFASLPGLVTDGDNFVFTIEERRLYLENTVAKAQDELDRLVRKSGR